MYFCISKYFSMKKNTIFLKVVTVIVLSVMTILPASAQHPLSTDFSISCHHFVDTVKVKMWNGAIIVPVEIDGKTRNLMFDSGADMGFWIGKEESWMEPSGDSTSTTDAQNRKRKMAILRIPSLKMGNITITGYPLIVTDEMSDFTCGIIDGAFGFTLAEKGLSFKFDTRDSLMIVTDRKGFFAKEEKGHAQVKYKDYKRIRPKVSVKIPFAQPKMLFDMGAVGSWFSIPQELLDIWSKNDSEIKRQLDAMTINRDTTVMSYASLFGASYDTVINGDLCFLEVKIGDLVLKNVWVSTATHNRAIGSAILGRVSLIVDAPKKSFYFLPNDGNPEIMVNNKPRGMELVPVEDGDPFGGMKVIVRKGTEAYEKGLRTGDYLISAAGIPIPDICTYQLLMYNGKVKHTVFRSPKGEIKEVDW